MQFSVLFVSFALLVGAFAEEEWRIPIQHHFGDEDNGWMDRGEILLFSSRADGNWVGRYDPGEYKLTNGQKQLLLAGIESNWLYKVRCASSLSNAQIKVNDEQSYAMSFTEPNRIVQSNLQEVLVLSVDMNQRRIMSITVQPVNMHYDVNYAPIMGEISADAFNSTVRLVHVTEGPAPDTVSYIQKLEQERQSREQGQGVDNRSFIAKYWMYIVPVVIFLVVSSSMNPEEGAAAPAR